MFQLFSALWDCFSKTFFELNYNSFQLVLNVWNVFFVFFCNKKRFFFNPEGNGEGAYPISSPHELCEKQHQVKGTVLTSLADIIEITQTFQYNPEIKKQNFYKNL